MNKKILYIGTFLLSACSSVDEDPRTSSISDGEMPAFRLAERLRQDGNHASALKFYEKAMQEEPDNKDIKLAYASALRGNQSFGDARRVLLTLNKEDPSNRTVRIELSRVLLEENNPKEAMTYLSPLLKDNKQKDAAILEAVALDLEGNHGNAQELYKEILKTDPHNLRVQSNLGLSLAVSGHSPEAIQILEEVHASTRATLRDRHNLAIAYERAGQLDKADNLWKMNLSAQEADETRQFFQALDDAPMDTQGFEKATSFNQVEETPLPGAESLEDKGNPNLANYKTAAQKIPPLKNPSKSVFKKPVDPPKTQAKAVETPQETAEEVVTSETIALKSDGPFAVKPTETHTAETQVKGQFDEVALEQSNTAKAEQADPLR